MFDFSDSTLEKVIIHGIGNKHQNEQLRLSNTEIIPDATTTELLKTYFLSAFKEEAFYNFFHSESLDKHAVYTSVAAVFEMENRFIEHSVRLAQLLYDCSEHPNIKNGEFYMALFKNCVVDDELVNAIGLFKSEHKDTFLKIYEQGEGFNVEHEVGISLNKLDKGCLIFETEKEFGYKICIVDKTNKKTEAQYWKETFLGVLMRQDNFYQTQNYLQVCKGFVAEVFNETNEIAKTEQIDMLNKSINYFKAKETFNDEEFAQEVMMGESAVIDAFKEYKNYYEETQNVKLEDGFDIAKNAVKKEQRKFKSVLKLDSNFHIYIHGDRSRIHKGFDEEKGLHFYQMFFEEEKSS